MTGIVKTDQIQGAQGTTVTVPTGHTLAVTSNATVGGTLGVTGNATAAGTLGVTGNTTVGGTLVNTGLITASAGVAIGGTGSANTLDDYEEGTWTPSITAYTGTQPTVTHSGGETPSGFYNKVGRLVAVTFVVPNFAVSGTTSGIMNISGLPFANSQSSWNGGDLSHYNVTFARGSTGNMSLRTFGTTSMGILSTNNGGTWGWELVSIFSGGSTRYISGSLTYQADA